jgi:hypothetical protein
MIPRWLHYEKGTYLNDVIRYVKGTFLAPDIGVNPIVIAAAPSATVPRFGTPSIIESSQEAVSEIFSFMGLHGAAVLADVSARMSVVITDTAFRRRLMNRDVLVNHVFGSNLQPFFARESIGLEGQQTLQFDFLNNSALGATSFEWCLEARKFQSTAFTKKQVTEFIGELRKRKSFLYPFWLTSDQPITIPAGGTRDVFFTSTRDVMQVQMATIASFISAGVAGDVVEGFQAQFFDAKTERPLQNQPVVRSCCSGTAGFPYILPTPLMMEPNTRMRVRFQNLITDQPIDIFFTWVGVAVYAASNIFETPGVMVANPEAYSMGVPQ